VTIALRNRQRAVRLKTRWLKGLAELAHRRCCEVPGSGPLGHLQEISVAIVSDLSIARLHSQFMRITGPTDVLTFDHGEIVISAETAAAHARRLSQPVELEIALYTVHGLLHLNGYDDRTPRDAMRMRRMQTRILRWCQSQLPPP